MYNIENVACGELKVFRRFFKAKSPILSLGAVMFPIAFEPSDGCVGDTVGRHLVGAIEGESLYATIPAHERLDVSFLGCVGASVLLAVDHGDGHVGAVFLLAMFRPAEPAGEGEK